MSQRYLKQKNTYTGYLFYNVHVVTVCYFKHKGRGVRICTWGTEEMETCKTSKQQHGAAYYGNIATWNQMTLLIPNNINTCLKREPENCTCWNNMKLLHAKLVIISDVQSHTDLNLNHCIRYIHVCTYKISLTCQARKFFLKFLAAKSKWKYFGDEPYLKSKRHT